MSKTYRNTKKDRNPEMKRILKRKQEKDFRKNFKDNLDG